MSNYVPCFTVLLACVFVGDVGITQEKVLRFLQEAVAMKGFNHANLLNLIGVCLPSDSSPQIIVPYMDRGDLHTFLRRHNPDMAQTLGERIERVRYTTKEYFTLRQYSSSMYQQNNLYSRKTWRQRCDTAFISHEHRIFEYS